MASFKYKHGGPVARAFHLSDKFNRGLRGPVGSGKSVACCVEIFRRACAQEPAPDGKRKTRFAVIRNTQPELRTTTIKTWLDWFPEDTFGKFNWAPPFTHKMRRGDLDCEVIFIALDKPEDVKKVLSLELTGAWINEAREVPKAIVDAVTMRVGRFPSERDGGCTWSGVIMDTNAPDDDHWWPIMSGDVPIPEFITAEEALLLVKPHNWEFFSQPGAMLKIKDAEGHVIGYEMNPARENQTGIKPSYYQNLITGKGAGWISVYVCNEYGSVVDGKPIYTDFSHAMHVAKEPLVPIPRLPIYVGLDFGLTPAAVFGQNLRGRWLIYRELVAADMGTDRFASLLRHEMNDLGPFEYIITGDPAGDQRAQTDEQTPFRVLRQHKISVRPAMSNDIALRLEAVTAPLVRLVDKMPGLLIDPRCKVLIKGFDGGYHYRRLNVSGAERYDTMPDKNRFSHVHDACQYMMLGGGEGRKLIGQQQQQPVVASRAWDVFKRKPKVLRRPMTTLR